MKKWQKISLVVVLVLLSVAMVYLFRAQVNGVFESDLASHMQAALDPETPAYTVTKVIYAFIYRYLGHSFGIAIFLTIVELLTIYVTKKLLEYFIGSKEQFKLWVYAILLNFVIAIFIPFVHKYWNIGVQESVEWHNSTFICMKPLGLLALLLFFQIRKTYLEKIDYKKYAWFCVTLIAVNLVKPNFILAFAPTMLIFLVVDFFQNLKNKKAILNIIIFGCAVLISLPIVLYQNSVLFVNDAGSGIAIDFLGALAMYHQVPVVSLLQSAAFPLFMLMTNLKDVIKNQDYLFIVVMCIVSLLTFLLFIETGERSSHGNFDFGYCFSLLPAFAMGVALLEARLKDASKAYLVASFVLLGLHIVSGLAYFITLLAGGSYE